MVKKLGPNGTVLLTTVVAALASALTFDGANIWVASTATNTVQKLSAVSGTVLGTYPVATGPSGLAFDGVNVWVAGANANKVTRVTATGVIGGGLNPAQVATLHWYAAGLNNPVHPVGTSPQGVAFDGTNIWVANSGSANVTKINAATDTTVGTYPVLAGPSGLAFDGTNIWVTDRGANKVTKLNAATGAVVGQLHRSATLRRASRSTAPTSGWRTAAPDTITKLVAATGALVGTVTVGPDPEGVAFDGQHIWVANSGDGTATELDAGDGSVVNTYTIGNSASFGGPFGVAFDGTAMWFATAGNSVVKLEVSDGTQTEVPVGIEPQAVAFDGTNIWVTNFGTSDATKLVAATGANVGRFPVGAYPTGIAFDGTNVWIANSHANSVSRL